jgi:hypothetical protein
VTNAAERALAAFWVHQVTVEPFDYTDSSSVDQFGTAYQQSGYYSDQTVYEAGEVVASGRFAYPASAPNIPVRSRVTLPARFGSRVVLVKKSAVGDGGGQPTPDHQVVGVL